MSWMATRTKQRVLQRILLVMVLLMLSATGGCKERQWKLWNAYSARFIDAQGRVFDPQGDQHTTSEGEAYALFFSLIANDRATFDRVLSWSQTNLAGGSLEMRLPAWLWGKSSDGPWKTLDANPASDADVWMAYTLVEAGRLWNNPSYSYLGLRMAALIAKNEVANLPGFGLMLIPGPTGFHNGNNWTLNPSYLPIFLFQRLAGADPTGPWASIASGIPRLLAQSTKHGFAMDWVQYVPGDGFYPAPKQGPNPSNKDANSPIGSYDAIRVYLWAGMTNANGGSRSAVLEAVPGMSAYLANHGAPPEKVSDQGIPLVQDGPVGFSAALLPYLRAYGQSREAGDQLVRMNALRDSSSGLYGKDLSYYDQNLALFGTGFMDARFGFGPGGELKVEWKRR
jgi:endo-1,4-beta-D-glucanase Y